MLKNKLKEYRKANRLTQQQLATALNIERSTYAYYENGKHRPSLDILKSLSRIYGVSLDALADNPQNHGRIRIADTTNTYNSGNVLIEDDEEDTEVYSSDDEKKKGSVNPLLSRLTRDEQLIVLLYRVIKDKDLAIAALKDLTEKQDI